MQNLTYTSRGLRRWRNSDRWKAVNVLTIIQTYILNFSTFFLNKNFRV